MSYLSFVLFFIKVFFPFAFCDEFGSVGKEWVMVFPKLQNYPVYSSLSLSQAGLLHSFPHRMRSGVGYLLLSTATTSIPLCPSSLFSKSVKLRARYQRQLSHASSFLPHWSWHHVCCRRNGILKERFLYQNLKFTALSAVCDNFKWNYLSIVMKQRGMRLLNLEDFHATK